MIINHKFVLCFVAVVCLFLSSDAMANIFEQSRFKHRLIIVKTDQSLSISSISQTITEFNRGISDRRLIIIVLNRDEVQVLPGNHTNDTKTQTQSIKHRLNGNQATLIGLDGGTKAYYDQFDLQQVFIDIDGMPMRRAELQDSGD